MENSIDSTRKGTSQYTTADMLKYHKASCVMYRLNTW